MLPGSAKMGISIENKPGQEAVESQGTQFLSTEAMVGFNPQPEPPEGKPAQVGAVTPSNLGGIVTPGD
jgi:hypothetical protein